MTLITGVILARNEEANIVDCLRSLRPYVAELLLIDMESTDRTRELAQPLVDRILNHRLIPHFDAARNIASSEAAHEWIWFLDADERVSENTGQIVRRVIQEQGDEIVAITIPFKSYFCGKWIQSCGWWPGYTMPRVLKRGRFRFAERLHGGVQFDGREVRLPPDPELAIEHFSYRSIEHYLEKFNRYTTVESQTLAEQGAPLTWETAIRAMVRDLWLYYEQNQGRQDGVHGWILSWLAGQYRWFSHAKLLDLPHDPAIDLLPERVPPGLDDVIRVMKEELAVLRAKKPQLPLGIVLQAPIWDPSGYATDSRLLVQAMASGERPLAVEPINWSDRTCEIPRDESTLLRALVRSKRPPFVAAITNCIPTLCRPLAGASLNILRTTFETDRIPFDWLPIIETFDEVWGFSNLDRLRFRRSGVPPEKIRVLNGYVDTDVFTSRGKKFDLPEVLHGRFVFLSVFDWQYRKGWDVLLKAYCSEFSSDAGVGLLLKVSSAQGCDLAAMRRQANEALATIATSLDERDDIVIWEQNLQTDELVSLYRSADAFVLASRGEGWGRPYMEAMACGLPTIGTRGSGNDDFMSDANSFLVATTWVDVPAKAADEIPVYRGHRWLEPQPESLRAQLRLVATNEKRRKSVARKGRADMRSGFSLACAEEAIEANLKAAERKFSSPDIPQANDSQIRVDLEGELFARHSFSNINERLALEFLADEEIVLSIRRVRHNPTHDDQSLNANILAPYVDRPLNGPPDVTIRHAFPPNWQPPESGRWVHIQPWEFGALPRDWVGPLRDHVDEIWAPSTYVKQVYVESGISSDKIHVIPWGVSPEVFTPDAPALFLPTVKKVRFLFVGGSIPRKGIDTLLDAYTSEFSADDDVCLVIKDMGTESFYRYGNFRDRILELIATENAPEIIYLDRDFTEGQLASLYTACDCLVAPYRGEGFGLPILEAMACGAPAIVPAGGASDDFVSNQTGYLLPSSIVECDHDWRLCRTGTQIEINPQELAQAMRRVYDAPQECATKGKKASDLVRKRFTWANTAKHMAGRLKVLAAGESSIADKAGVSSTLEMIGAATITVCMLAQNNEQTIGAALGRIRPHVDEIIVLDLDSTDGTAQVAAEYGSRVYRGRFNGSLSDLRNTTLRRATSDWVLVLDADEWLHEQEWQKLHNLIVNVPEHVFGARLGVSHRYESTEVPNVERTVRLFRNHNEVVFSHRGCENIESQIERLGGQIVDAELSITRIVATPCNGEPFRCSGTKLELLHLDRMERPDDPLAPYRLGELHYNLGNFFHAECYLNDVLQRLQPQESFHSQVATLLASAHRKKGDPERAVEVETFVQQAGGSNGAAPPPTTPLAENTGARLYLGAGRKRLQGHTHVDVQQGDGIDVVHDLGLLPWPWEDGSVAHIVAEDVVEHLKIDVVQFCNEAWRVLKTGGELFIRTPHHKGESSWIDPTHCWHLDERAFQYLDPETQWGGLYPQYTDRKWRILSLGVRGPQNIHALLMPRKQ